MYGLLMQRVGFVRKRPVFSEASIALDDYISRYSWLIRTWADSLSVVLPPRWILWVIDR